MVANSVLQLFAIVGWMDVLIPRGFYTFFFKPLSIAVVAWGAVMSTRDARRALRGDSAALRLPAIFFLLIGMLACVILFNLIGSQRLMPQAQGRYCRHTFHALVDSNSRRQPAPYKSPCRANHT